MPSRAGQLSLNFVAYCPRQVETPAARRSDPASSHLAAEQITIKNLHIHLPPLIAPSPDIERVAKELLSGQATNKAETSLDRFVLIADGQIVVDNATITDILDGRDTGVGVCNEPWQSVRMRLIELVRRANAPGEPALYQHDDGRYALALGDVARHKLTDGDPGWHRVPLDVVAAGEDPPGLGALSQDYLDACRFRLLTDDHGDREVRDQVRRIIERLPVMSYAAACRDLDRIFQNKAAAKAIEALENGDEPACHAVAGMDAIFDAAPAPPQHPCAGYQHWLDDEPGYRKPKVAAGCVEDAAMAEGELEASARAARGES